MVIGILGGGLQGQKHFNILYPKKRNRFSWLSAYKLTYEGCMVFDPCYKCDFDNAIDLINKCELIVIATPNATHFELAKKSLEAKKITVVEKPLTLNKAEAIALYEIAEKNNVPLHVVHQEYLNPFWLLAREHLLLQSYGMLRVTRQSHRATPQDALMRLLIHDLTLLASRFGEGGGTIRNLDPLIVEVKYPYTNWDIQLTGGQGEKRQWLWETGQLSGQIDFHCPMLPFFWQHLLKNKHRPILDKIHILNGLALTLDLEKQRAAQSPIAPVTT